MTAPAPTSTWSVNRRAARAVVLNARDTDDARMLLDMLGLVEGPQGRDVLPDDIRNLDIELHHSGPGRDERDDVEPLSRQAGREHTVPAGLRSPAPTAAPSAPPSPRALPAKRTAPPLPPIVHGTAAGYVQHHERGALPVCADCEIAAPREESQPVTATADIPDVEHADGPYVTALRARDLFSDQSYQRPLDTARVKRMAAAWNPRMLGVLDVSDRGPAASPRYALVNGQHRCAAALQAAGYSADLWVPCSVHEGLDPAGEAALMVALDQSTKALTSWDRWKSRRAAGDTAVLAVERVAHKHGMTVTPGSFGAVGIAEKLWKAGGDELLDTVVTVIVTAYGAAPEAMKAPMLTGVGYLVQHHGADIDLDRLARALAKATPQQLRAQADAVRQVEGGTLGSWMARGIAGLYNRLPGARLDVGSAR